MDSEARYTGVVCWFAADRLGYGFISRPGEKDLFVHFSDINCEGFKTIKKGQTVTFALGVNNSGRPKAIDVTVIAEAK